MNGSFGKSCLTVHSYTYLLRSAGRTDGSGSLVLGARAWFGSVGMVVLEEGVVKNSGVGQPGWLAVLTSERFFAQPPQSAAALLR